jgi:hypothetical protein
MSNLSGDHLFTRVYGKTHVYVIITCKGSLSVLYNATDCKAGEISTPKQEKFALTF